MRRIVMAILALLTAAIVGCSPIAVNVPPLPGDTAFHSPNNGSVVTVVAESLKHVLKRYPVDGPYAIDLPHGTSDETYSQLLAELPEGGAVAGRSGASTSPIYRVVQVRVRGMTALVDVVVPQQPTEQLVTVTVVRDGLTPWYARSSRVWRVPVEQALMMSARSLPPPSEPAAPSDEPAVTPEPEAQPKPAPEPADEPEAK